MRGRGVPMGAIPELPRPRPRASHPWTRSHCRLAAMVVDRPLSIEQQPILAIPRWLRHSGNLYRPGQPRGQADRPGTDCIHGARDGGPRRAAGGAQLVGDRARRPARRRRAGGRRRGGAPRTARGRATQRHDGDPRAARGRLARRSQGGRGRRAGAGSGPRHDHPPAHGRTQRRRGDPRGSRDRDPPARGRRLARPARGRCRPARGGWHRGALGDAPGAVPRPARRHPPPRLGPLRRRAAGRPARCRCPGRDGPLDLPVDRDHLAGRHGRLPGRRARDPRP